jgi:hypothetical protein
LTRPQISLRYNAASLHSRGRNLSGAPLRQKI